MVPSNLSIWVQRAGRAGRSRLLSARAILLVQPTVFQEVKPSSDPTCEETENINYRKTIDEGLRKWIETEGCRREVADEYFWDGNERKRELHGQIALF